MPAHNFGVPVLLPLSLETFCLLSLLIDGMESWTARAGHYFDGSAKAEAWPHLWQHGCTLTHRCPTPAGRR